MYWESDVHVLWGRYYMVPYMVCTLPSAAVFYAATPRQWNVCACGREGRHCTAHQLAQEGTPRMQSSAEGAQKVLYTPTVTSIAQ